MKAVVLIPDGTYDNQGVRFVEDGVKFQDTVPVVLDSEYHPKRFVGNAKLYWENGRVMADLSLYDQHINEKLALLTPYAMGEIKALNNNTVESCSIRHVSVGLGPNADPRIKPIGEQE